MKNSIAYRHLLFSRKGEDKRLNLKIFISAPEFVPPSLLPFKTDVEVAVCNIEIIGFDEPYTQSVIGADLLQALQLATDIDPILKGFSKLYDFFYEDGEPYFGAL